MVPQASETLACSPSPQCREQEYNRFRRFANVFILTAPSVQACLRTLLKLAFRSWLPRCLLLHSKYSCTLAAAQHQNNLVVWIFELPLIHEWLYSELCSVHLLPDTFERKFEVKGIIVFNSLWICVPTFVIYLLSICNSGEAERPFWMQHASNLQLYVPDFYWVSVNEHWICSNFLLW